LNPIDWKFSSARNYGDDDQSILEIDLNWFVSTSETLALAVGRW
jgi:hypothetical protein